MVGEGEGQRSNPVDVVLPLERKFSGREARLMFDWSRERRNQVTADSRSCLSDFLAKHGITGQDLKTITGYWGGVIQAFKEGEVLGQIRFSRNQLTGHAEYHVAKMLTLSTLLFDKTVPTEKQTSENALAVALTGMLHDLGYLDSCYVSGEEAGIKDEGRQLLIYSSDHVQRSIDLADELIPVMDLSEGVDREALKRKVKALIAATDIYLDMSYGVYRDGKLDPPRLEDVGIVELLSVDSSETSWQDTTAKEYRQVIEAVARDKDQREEMLDLVKVVTAADHGSYFFEPCRLGEIIALWQERNRMEFDREGGGLISFAQPQETYLFFLASDFARMQHSIYGGLWERLDENPFVARQSVERAKEICMGLNSMLVSRYREDRLLRIEGFFSPVQLHNLAERLHVLYKSNIKSEILSFSQNFASGFSLPSDFRMLATSALRAIYREAISRKDGSPEVFFSEAIVEINRQMGPELTQGGTYSLHISPFAYLEEKGALGPFIQGMIEAKKKAVNGNIVGGICLALREDRAVDTARRSELISTIGNLPAEYKDLISVGLGGLPEDNQFLKESLEELAQAGIPRVAYIGLEKNIGSLRERLMIILGGNTEDLSLIFAGNFGLVTDIYDKWRQSSPQMAEKLANTIRGISPLQYVFTGREKEYQEVERFIKTFRRGDDRIPCASGNSCMLGDLGLAAQEVLQTVILETKSQLE